MAADFYIGQGDTAASLADTLKDSAGAAVSIQGATVRLTVTPAAGGAAIISAATASNDQVGDGSDGTKGKVSFALSALQTAVAGDYFAQWTVTFSGGAIQTFPNDGYILIRITADAPIGSSTRFATSAELANRLGLDFTAGEHVRAGALLALATALIQDETGQLIAQVTAETLTRPGVWGNRLRFPERPVTAVTSVKIDGVTLATDDWYRDGDELVRFGGWGGPQVDVEVVHTHGYAIIPGAVKAVCLEVATRVWTNPGNARQEGYGLEQISYSSSNGLLLTDDERRTVNEAIRRTEASVVLR